MLKIFLLAISVSMFSACTKVVEEPVSSIIMEIPEGVDK
jgi:hypothetical protein